MRSSLIVLALCSAFVRSVDVTPWQIHINYGDAGAATSMHLTWSTPDTTCTQVRFGVKGQQELKIQNGTSNPFDAPTQTIHVVKLSGLKPGTAYDYEVGCFSAGSSAISQQYHFNTAPDTMDWQPRIAIFGDMGLVNEVSLPILKDYAEQGKIDAILHCGDFAYDLHDEGGHLGDTWMQTIQDIAAIVPYHTDPGNHEADEDFKQYRARFPAMPTNSWSKTTGGSLYHSLDLGHAHFSMLSSEVYFYSGAHGKDMLPQQYAWLEEDLQRANQARQQGSGPGWMAMCFHRPMMCAPNDDNDDCHHGERSVIRNGTYGLEPLAMKYGVDLAFAAHEHSYSRTYPVWNETFEGGPKPYENPGLPIHLISGGAGCPEQQDKWGPNPPAWSAFQANVYGFGVLEVLNGSHADWSFVQTPSGEVIDTVHFVQENHGPFPIPSSQ